MTPVLPVMSIQSASWDASEGEVQKIVFFCVNTCSHSHIKTPKSRWDQTLEKVGNKPACEGLNGGKLLLGYVT